MKTKREFKLTEFEPPTRIRWAEVSKNHVTAPEGWLRSRAEGHRDPSHDLQRPRGAWPGQADRPAGAAAPPERVRTTSGRRSSRPSRRPEAGGGARNFIPADRCGRPCDACGRLGLRFRSAPVSDDIRHTLASTRGSEHLAPVVADARIGREPSVSSDAVVTSATARSGSAV
jgi:hypothetical protein